MKLLPLLPVDTVQFSQSVRGLHFFGAMDMVLLERVLEGLELRQYAGGDRICVQGEEGDFFFVVRTGKLTVTTRRGGLSLARRVATLGPGDCFGEMALLHRAPRNATVSCATSSTVFVLPAAHFQGVLQRNPEFAKEIRDLAAARQAELDRRDG